MSDILFTLGLDSAGFRVDLETTEEAQDRALDQLEKRFRDLARTVKAASADMRTDFLSAMADIRKAAGKFVLEPTIQVKVDQEQQAAAKKAVKDTAAEAKAAAKDVQKLNALLRSGRSIETLLKAGNPAGAADSLGQVVDLFRRIDALLARIGGKPLDIETETAVRNVTALQQRLRLLSNQITANGAALDQTLGIGVGRINEQAGLLRALRAQIRAADAQGTPEAIGQINAALERSRSLINEISGDTLDIRTEKALRDLQAVQTQLEKLRQPRPVRSVDGAAVDPDVQAARLATLQARSVVGAARSGTAELADVRKRLSEIEALLTRLRAKPLDLKTQSAVNGLEAVADQLRTIGRIDPSPRARFQLQTLNQEFQKFGGILRNISTVLSTLGVGGGIFALIYGFKALVADGVDFNTQVEKAKIALATSVQATAEKITLDERQLRGLSAIEGVQGNVNRLVDLLKRDALFVTGTFEDLLGVSEAIVPTVLKLGGTLEDVERLTRLTGIAASVYGLNFKVATNGVLQLLTGTINKRNELIKRLPIESFDSFKKDLADVSTRLSVVTTELQKLEAAAPLLERSYGAASESVRDLVQQFAAASFAPLQARLQAFFNSIINASLEDVGDGTKRFSDSVRSGLEQASRIVANLTAQFAVLARQLFASEGRSFLDVLEETLPTVLSSLFNVAGAIKSVFDLLTANGSIALKVVGYFLTFQIARGILVSFIGTIANFSNSVAASVEFVGQLRTRVLGMVTAIQSGQSATTALSGALGGLGVVMKGLGIAALVIAVAELVRGFISARSEAAEVRLALQDVNNLNFDRAITELRRLESQIRETGLLAQLTDFTGSKERAQQAASILSAARTALEGAAKRAGVEAAGDGLDTARRVLVELPRLRTEAIDDAQRATTKVAQDAAKAQVIAIDSASRAAENYVTVLGAASRVADGLRQRFRSDGRRGSQLSGRPTGREEVFGSDVLNAATREVQGLSRLAVEREVAQRELAKIEVKSQRPTPKEDAAAGAAARRLEDTRRDVLSAYRAELEARLQVLDRATRAEQEAVEASVAEQRRTEQQAADVSVEIAARRYREQLALLSGYFDQVKALASKELGKVGIQTFADTLTVSAEDLESRLREFAVGALRGPQDAATKAQSDSAVDAIRRVIDIRRQQQSGAEALEQAEAKSARDRAVANLRAAEFTREQIALNAERLAQTRVEVAQQRAVAADLDARIDQERRLAALREEAIRTRNAEQNTRELSEISKRTDLSPEAKAELAQSRLSVAAAREQSEIDANRLETARSILTLTTQEYQQRQQLIQLDESRAALLGEIVGNETVAAVRAREQIKQKRILLNLEEATRKEALADQVEATDAKAARDLRDDARQLRQAAEVFRVSQLNYIQSVAGQVTNLANVIERFSGLRLPFLGQINTTLEAFSNLRRLTENGGIRQAFDAARGGRSGLGGAVAGALGLAGGPVGQAASSVLGLFVGFFNRLNQGFARLLNDATRRLDRQLSATLESLRNNRLTTGAAIADLEKQLGSVEAQFPDARRTSGFLFAVPLLGIASAISNSRSNAERTRAITEAREKIQQELDRLQQDARQALQRLEEETIPLLQVTPDLRDFTTRVRELRREIAEYLSLPGADASRVNELFNLRVVDLQREAQDKLTDAKRSYLDLLRDEAATQKELLGLDDERSSVEADFRRQRAEILGLAQREVSRGQRLREAETERDRRLREVEERRSQAQDRLAEIQAQTALYREQFDLTRDARTLEAELQALTLSRQREQLSALQQMLETLRQIQTLSVQSFAGLAPAPAASTSNLNVSIGSIVVGEGSSLSRSDVQGGVLDALREVQRSFALKGPAFGDA